MKTRTMLGALIMAALIGSSVGVGYAGSDGGGLPGGTSLFRCYVILDGAKPPAPLILEVNDIFTEPRNVRIGTARLLCTPADGTPVQGNLAAENPFASDQFTCYDALPGRLPHDQVTLADPFVESQTVRLGFAPLLCTGARICPDGNCALP